MNISILGEFVEFDPETRVLSTRLDFLDPDSQRQIEMAVIEKKRTIVKFSLRFRQSKKDRIQKAWYGSLSLIASSDQFKMAPFATNLEELDDYLRSSIFPARMIKIGDTEVPAVARMRHLSDEALEKCIEKLHDRYSYLTVYGKAIDFSNLRKS